MMATNKRRKLDGDNAPPSPAAPVMSAFQRLRALQSAQLASRDKAAKEMPSQLSTENVENGNTPASSVPTHRTKRRPAAAQKQSPTVVEQEAILSAAAEREDSNPPTPVLSPLPGTPRLEPKGRQITQHSSFRPNKRNFQPKPDGVVQLTTSDGERLVILGSYGVKVQEGEATICGANLTPLDSIQWVHAPHCHALPVLRTSEGTVIELQPHAGAESLRQLAKLNPAFGKLWNESSTEGVQSTKHLPTFQIIFSSSDVPKKYTLQELVSPPEWNKKLASLVAAKRKSKSSPVPSIFLCGPKSSGKSTFGRLLANRLITDRAGSRSNPWSTIMLLDIDPGQPEFSPPGVISLVKLSRPNLSPSFCHSTLSFSVRSHAMAAVTPALDPSHYIECVLNLFSVYQEQFASYTLIINTPGWIQGTGLDILTQLIQNLSPTEVIYLSLEGPEDTVSTLQSTTKTKFSTIPSSPQSSESPARTALTLRTMSTMSYFHSQTPETWVSTPLSSITPWRVSYLSQSRKGFAGILCYDNQPAPFLLAEAINGMLLGLVKVEDARAFRDLDLQKIVEAGESKIPLINNPAARTLDPKFSRLLGLVLIRGVDTERKELQMLGPAGLGDLVKDAKGEELVLVAGKFDTPTWAYSEELYRKAWNEGQDEDVDSDEEGRGENADEYPWVEMLYGSEKRGVGAKVWRVRRDLGRN